MSDPDGPVTRVPGKDSLLAKIRNFVLDRPKVVLLGGLVAAISVFISIPIVRSENLFDHFERNYFLLVFLMLPIVAMSATVRTRYSAYVDKKLGESLELDLAIPPSGDTEGAYLREAIAAQALHVAAQRTDASKNLAIGFSLTALAIFLSISIVLLSRASSAMETDLNIYIWHNLVPKAAVVIFIQSIAGLFIARYGKILASIRGSERELVQLKREAEAVRLILNKKGASVVLRDYFAANLARGEPHQQAEAEKSFISGLIENLSLSFGKAG